MAGALAAHAAPCDNLPSSAYDAVSRGPAWEKKAARIFDGLTSGESLLLGDSIVADYPKKYASEISPYGVNGFGIGGDGVENLIWTLKKFPITKTNAYNIILIIGGEDVASMEPKVLADKIAAATCIIKKRFARRFRGSRYIQVVSLLPQGENLKKRRVEIAQVNALLDEQADRFRYVFRDVNADFKDECGSKVPCPLYAGDGYNLSGKGYRLLTEILVD